MYCMHKNKSGILPWGCYGEDNSDKEYEKLLVMSVVILLKF